jgi:hypothetical protein
MITFATAASIVRNALARHGSRSQCDLSHLLGQLDYKAMTLEAFTRAAEEAADDLVGI